MPNTNIQTVIRSHHGLGMHRTWLEGPTCGSGISWRQGRGHEWQEVHGTGAGGCLETSCGGSETRSPRNPLPAGQRTCSQLMHCTHKGPLLDNSEPLFL